MNGTNGTSMDPLQLVTEASRGMWSDAHNPGGLIRNEIQAQVLWGEISKLVEKDPIGAARSWIGRLMLPKYKWLLTPEDAAEMGVQVEGAYPRRLPLAEILGADIREVIEQLIAEEYFEDAGELTPYTPEAFGVRLEVPNDIFATTWRPDVTVEAVDAGGATQTFNQGGAVTQKPKEGFREI